MGILKNALHILIMVKNLLSVEMDADIEWGLGTTGWQGITIFIAQRSWTNLHPRPLNFLTGQKGVLQGSFTRHKTYHKRL